MYNPEEGDGAGTIEGSPLSVWERYIAEHSPVRREWSKWNPHQESTGSSSTEIVVEGDGGK